MKFFDKTKWAAALLALAVGLAGCGPVEGNDPSSKPQEGSRPWADPRPGAAPEHFFRNLQSFCILVLHSCGKTGIIIPARKCNQLAICEKKAIHSSFWSVLWSCFWMF